MLTAAFCAGSLDAHHSYAAYDHQNPISVEGVIETISFVNPHVVLTIKTPDGGKYLAEWGSTSELQRSGVRRDTLKVGDRVVVRGAPKRDPKDHTVSLLSEIRRPADGWTWKLQ